MHPKLFTLALLAGAASAQQLYTPVALPIPADAYQSIPREINDAGIVVGQAEMYSTIVRAAWIGPSGAQVLPTFGSLVDEAVDIDRKGRVLLALSGSAYLWTASSGLQPLGFFDPTGLNELGVVCGSNSSSKWVRWDALHGLQVLGSYPGGSFGLPHDINDAGVLVGHGQVPGESYSQPMRYVPGLGFELLSIGASMDAGEARCINSAGQSAGYAGVDQANPRKHVWSGTSAAHAGATESDLVDIDALGRCVGWTQTPAGQRAILFADGVSTELGALVAPGSGWVFQEALAMNDAGQIVGTGRLNGVTRGFRLDPPARVHALGGQLGGTLAFVHDAPSFAGKLAISAVSATGMSGLLSLDGFGMHLDVDALTLALIAQPALSTAVLDASGHAQTAAIALPSDPSLAGAPLWVASAIFDLGLGRVIGTSTTVKTVLE